MSRAIRISEKTAKELLSLKSQSLSSYQRHAYEELEKALQPKRSVLSHAKVKAKKKRSKGKETAAIRAAVFERSRGLCDYCQRATPTDLEHPFGRVRAKQSVETCLAVCRPCHRNRTDLIGGAATWWHAIADAFARHGLLEWSSYARGHATYHAVKTGLVEQAAGVAK